MGDGSVVFTNVGNRLDCIIFLLKIVMIMKEMFSMLMCMCNMSDIVTCHDMHVCVGNIVTCHVT